MQPMTETTTDKIYRHSDDRVIAGVSRGLGDYFNLDPVLIRVGWVALFFLSGVAPAVIAYLITWWLVPDAQGRRSSTPLIWLAVLIIVPLVLMFVFMVLGGLLALVA